MLVTLLLFLMDPGADSLYLLAFTWRELRAREPFIDLRGLGGNVPPRRVRLRLHPVVGGEARALRRRGRARAAADIRAGQLVACALILSLDAQPGLGVLAVTSAFGVPQGLNNLALQNSVYRQADPERMSASSGLLRAFSCIGSMAASALAHGRTRAPAAYTSRPGS
ncbi:hypothetical protein [Actinomadura macrotermitis]|uniref:MFS transporter n=1 Tax=Actinomadura macrotermitis TaxID=2585200 RepID=A0A7K0C015_9ACTN|nr:hypothetical protein [Actinomadura macrotermitis]MQY06795.1 hypothetical protein [Actinomadura macrotermitis]